MASTSSKSGCLRPLLFGVIGLTFFSGATILLLFTRGLYNQPDKPASALAFTEALVFDGDTLLDGRQTVIVEGDEIRCIGTDCEIPEGARVIDLEGKTLMPGLVDSYLRFFAPTKENLEGSDISGLISFIKQRPEVRMNLISAGVTTVFSAGDLPQNILLLRSKMDDGTLAGPRILTVGPDFCATDGWPYAGIYAGNESLEDLAVIQVATPAEGQLEASNVIDLGVDALKVVYDDFRGDYPKLSPEAVKGIQDVAQQEGRWVIARCGTQQDILDVLDMGITRIAYGPNALLDSSAITRMAAAGVIYYPMLARRPKAEHPRIRQNIKALADAGVRIGTGSDPRGKEQSFATSLQQEMVAQVEAGLDPYSVLREATSGGAAALRLDDRLGVIGVGMQADLIVVEGNPVENMESLSEILWVVQAGYLMVEEGELVD